MAKDPLHRKTVDEPEAIGVDLWGETRMTNDEWLAMVRGRWMVTKGLKDREFILLHRDFLEAIHRLTKAIEGQPK